MKIRQTEGERVFAVWHRGEAIHTVCTGDARARAHQCGAGGANRHAGQRAAGAIGDDAIDSTGGVPDGLASARGREQKHAPRANAKQSALAKQRESSCRHRH